jgi:hypothetical protein
MKNGTTLNRVSLLRRDLIYLKSKSQHTTSLPKLFLLSGGLCMYCPNREWGGGVMVKPKEMWV